MLSPQADPDTITDNIPVLAKHNSLQCLRRDHMSSLVRNSSTTAEQDRQLLNVTLATAWTNCRTYCIRKQIVFSMRHRQPRADATNG
jgi:hypothetical protein